MSAPGNDWGLVTDHYRRRRWERAGRWCETCGRVHVEHLTEFSGGWYWHQGPHMKSYPTEQAARAAADEVRSGP